MEKENARYTPTALTSIRLTIATVVPMLKLVVPTRSTSADAVKSKTYAAVASMLSIEMEPTHQTHPSPRRCSFTLEYMLIYLSSLSSPTCVGALHFGF